MPTEPRPRSSSSSGLSQISYLCNSIIPTDGGAGETFHTVDLSSDLDGLDVYGLEQWSKLDSMPALGASNDDDDGNENLSAAVFGGDHEVIQPQGGTGPKSTRAIHRWIKSLHRRAVQRQELIGIDVALNREAGEADSLRLQPRRPYHYPRSSSDSSAAFVTGVKSASASLASTSLLGRSRKNTLKSSRGHSRTDRSSKASAPGMRLSADSAFADRSIAVDPEITERSLQRRRILEELISTEESYIGDVRFLMNVYITILASLPSLSTGLRSSINRNLTEIVELHEEILGDLHRAVPHSEYTQMEVPLRPTKSSVAPRGHQRGRSLDAVPEHKGGMSWLQAVPGMTSGPRVAAEVARIFSKRMSRFFVYEEYGAKYELMIKDVASAYRTMPKWNSYQKGLENLAAALGTASNHADHSKKSLTIGDLLVKPIQRVCKYPLLFSELLKFTPVYDCPQSHLEIEDTLVRLREATGEINRATNNDRIKATLEKTWILQDRLIFLHQAIDGTSKNKIRSLGHIQLCGTLHICWQTKEGVSGQYMITLLYRDWLCLALAGRNNQIYTIRACISVDNIKVEAADNGRGLQCHTAPYSWKIVFICDHQLYEIVMTACTPAEENAWRDRLSHPHISLDSADQRPSVLFSSLSLDIKALGTVFGKPG